MRTVLLVDDEPDIRTVARLQLESHGYSVSEARDGLEALDVLKAVEPDVVLLDLEMPRMDGITFLRRLRSGPRAHLPVVVFSADDAPETMQVLEALGCRGRVSKPYEVRQLLGAVATAAD
jgi:two-component system chemotaxis response regulator CheY